MAPHHADDCKNSTYTLENGDVLAPSSDRRYRPFRTPVVCESTIRISSDVRAQAMGAFMLFQRVLRDAIDSFLSTKAGETIVLVLVDVTGHW